jgi:hypothetical protein
VNPVETIQAAIEKLDTQKRSSTPGPWNLHFADEFDARVGIDHGSRPTSLTGTMLRPDAELIVTLHRTIDAQLAILRDGLHKARFSNPGSGISYRVEIILASAILGEG